MKVILDYYPNNFPQCNGCGRLSNQGNQLKTIGDGFETLNIFIPAEYNTAILDSVYCELLASLIDCHRTGSAAFGIGKRKGN